MKYRLFVALLFLGLAAPAQPRIVNIVNFIRLLEPRDSTITEDVLYQTVVRQVQLMREYRLPGTFLLQYDALIDPRYQLLLRSLPRDSFEIGAWWELPQPLVEQAGIRWRGRYPWDWRANVGFSTGYTPVQREKLVDTYMKKFKEIFGRYPVSVGSWFIDAHSLAYMESKYHIVASCNCKDQYGTDGYTLWGGYWNQGYYPSKRNSYMPAQDTAGQIDVPIFRMLGSDPIRQYDNGLGTSRQAVVTLEPVYAFGGGDSAWVHWFFDQFIAGPDLGFNYAQAGQENSFTWRAMAKGLKRQFPLIAKLRDEGKLTVESLGATGRWFRTKYRVTPTTSWTVLHDLDSSDKKTVWFDSRFYRINLLWEGGGLRVRDIHMFDERLASEYETKPATANDCRFFTLPVVDGFLWSKPGQLAGLRIKAFVGGKEILLAGGSPTVANLGDTAVSIRWPLTTVAGVLEIELREDRVMMNMKSTQPLDWWLALNVADSALLPVKAIGQKRIDCKFQGMRYGVKVQKGICLSAAPVENGISAAAEKEVWRIRPEGNRIELRLRTVRLP